MAKTTHDLTRERKERKSSEWYEGHQKYLKNTSSYRKFGGVGSASGKVHDLDAKGKALERKINSPKAKAKRSLRMAQYEGHLNSFGVRQLAELNHK